MYSGKCLCGAVAISVNGVITAYATNGFVNRADFVIEKGQTVLSAFSFKPGRTRYFCQYCGSPVYSSNEQDKARVRVRLGIFDSAIIERPMSHNFVDSKANWEDLTADLPHYSTFEPNRAIPKPSR